MEKENTCSAMAMIHNNQLYFLSSQFYNLQKPRSTTLEEDTLQKELKNVK